MEKWVIIDVEHLVLQEYKEVLKKTKNVGMSKGHRSQPQRAPNIQSWNDLSNKVNSVVLNYNPKCKVNIHTFI